MAAKPFGEVVVSGAASGHLYVWEGRNCIRAVKAHSGESGRRGGEEGREEEEAGGGVVGQGEPVCASRSINPPQLSSPPSHHLPTSPPPPLLALGAITALHVIGKMDDGSGETSNAGPSTGGFDKPGGLCTGSTDGKIQLWSAELEVGACFDLASLGGVSKAVQSVNWDFANHKILIGSW